MTGIILSILGLLGATDSGTTVPTDCNSVFIVVVDAQTVCTGQQRIWYLTDGDDSASETVTLTIDAEGSLTIAAQATPGNPDQVDKFYIVSEAVANAAPGMRPPLAAEIFGPFSYGLGGVPFENLLSTSQLSAIVSLQSSSPENTLVLIEEQIGRDIFMPGVEFFGGIRIEFEPDPEIDFGDAPAPYPTLLVNDGARHVIVPGISMTPFLGFSPDSEADGQPDNNARGDDLNGNDDENGLQLPRDSVLILGQTEQFRIVSESNNVFLNAWIDFNRDGDWTDPGEKIANGMPLVAGFNNLNLPIPMTASVGDTFMRFRLSSEQMLDPTGLAIDGEVEDIRVLLAETDFGDAPNSYGTLRASGGAYHQVDLAYYLGSVFDIDVEADGAPGVFADGDDLTGIADENGLTFDPNVVPGDTFIIEAFNGGNAAFFSMWLDYNRDGDFADAGELEVANVMIPAASGMSFPVTVPAGADFGQSYVRARLTEDMLNPVSATGFGGVGEVEDHPVFFILGFDYGDAPDGYPTLAVDDGARHAILADFHLGQQIDADLDGQPDTLALGDDASVLDDEDGVSFTELPGTGPVLEAGGVNTVDVVASRDGGALHVFLDVNGDFDFDDAGEMLLDNYPLQSGNNAVPLNVPQITQEMESYIRFRLTFELNILEGPVGPDNPAGENDRIGEVEDYLITLQFPLFEDGFE